MEKFDVVVIGAGPGGYVAAIKASQLGFKTAIVEKEHLGGVCLNWGCIPTKALLHNAEVVHTLSQGKTYGFSFENLQVDYSVAHKRSRQVSNRLTKGVGFLMKKNKITVVEGTASLKSRTEVEVQPDGRVLQADNIIIATGARARMIPDIDFDGDKIITYHQALELTELPESILVVGAGAIGLEFATVMNRYGTDVTVVEMLPRVLPNEDEEVCKEAEKIFERDGITIKTGTRVESIDVGGSKVVATVSRDDEQETIEVDKVLVAIGVQPNSENLGLEAVGVDTDRGHIVIDDQMRTSVPNIYAIGDVTGKLALAHVGSAQAIVAAEAIAGHQVLPLNYANMPRCTYSHPEVASVGLTEQQAREQGYEVKTAKFPFQANGKALGMAANSGFVKIVSETKYNEVLGVHLIGEHVTELIAGPTGMIGLETTAEELAHTVHPHPTMSEVVMEAAHALADGAIHM